jgi:ferredoxin-type protein NapH
MELSRVTKNPRAAEGVMRRRKLQWALAPVVTITIGLGWKYPAVGYTVPAVMLIGMIGSLFNGRYVCGNLCPRGAFFDRYFGWTRKGRRIPAALRGPWLRWLLFGALMAFMVFRISRNPGSWEHWGRVFWLMCAVTTGVGIVLAVLMHPRAWCSFCPMGTLQSALGGNRGLYLIDVSCRECKTCEKACPMDLPIVIHKAEGVVKEGDCLKCLECAAVCPIRAVHVR